MKPEQILLLQESLEKFGKATMIAEGSSMWPAIPNGTQIVIRKPDGIPRTGSIGVFLESDRIIVHRIMLVGRKNAGKSRVWARGDAYLGSTHQFFMDQMIGFVEGIKPPSDDRNQSDSPPIPISKTLSIIGMALSPLLYIYWKVKNPATKTCCQT